MGREEGFSDNIWLVCLLKHLTIKINKTRLNLRLHNMYISLFARIIPKRWEDPAVTRTAQL